MVLRSLVILSVRGSCVSARSRPNLKVANIRALFSRLLGLVCVAGSKKSEKSTQNRRGSLTRMPHGYV